MLSKNNNHNVDIKKGSSITMQKIHKHTHTHTHTHTPVTEVAALQTAGW